MNVMYKIVLGVAVLLLIMALSVWGIKQYGNSRVGAQEISTLQEAAAEAVVERRDALSTDVAQTERRAATAVLARSVVKRERIQSAQVPVLECDAVGDAERIRLLNLAITEVNAIVQRANELPSGVSGSASGDLVE